MKKLERFGELIAQQQVRKPALFIGVFVMIIALTLPGIPLLLYHIEPSLEKILPQEVDEIKTMNDMRSQYGADMMYLVLTTQGPSFDVGDPDVLFYLDILTGKLRENDYLLEVTSLADVVKEVNNGVIPSSNKDIRELLRLSPKTPLYVNHDYSLTIVHIRSDTGATAAVIKRVVEDMEDVILSVDEYNPGLDVQITGFNAIDKATFEVIMSDFSYITGFSFLFMLIFLFLYFRSWRKVLGAVSVIMVSLLITAGITGYLNITITVVTMVAAAMIMALGISYGINVTYDYYQLREGMSKQRAIVRLNKNLIRALIGSSLTTSAGFLALLFGIIPAMKNLGIVLALGITITLAVSIFLLPVLLYKLDKNEKRVKA